MLLVLALGAAAWWWRDAPPLRPWAARLQQALPAAWRDALSPTANPPNASPAAASVRKCRGPAGVVYTDGRCPAGHTEQALDGGSLTVLPAAPTAVPARPAADAASAPPALRRLGASGTLPDRAERLDREVQRSQNLPP